MSYYKPLKKTKTQLIYFLIIIFTIKYTKQLKIHFITYCKIKYKFI